MNLLFGGDLENYPNQEYDRPSAGAWYLSYKVSYFLTNLQFGGDLENYPNQEYDRRSAGA